MGRLRLVVGFGTLALLANSGCSGVSSEAEPEAGAAGDAAASGSSGAGRGGGAAGARNATGGVGGAAGRGGATGKGGRGGACSAVGGTVSMGGADDGGEAGDAGRAGESAAGTGGGSTGGKVHGLCASPTPEELPDVPMVRTNPTGRPLFDLWRDLTCEEISAPLCSEGGNTCSGCLRDTSGGEGVCTYSDSDLRCDGDGEGLSYKDGECWLCSPIEAHARACCEGLAGFDCRAWPFPEDGKPGTVCARHEDCEPGLLCGPGGMNSFGYGICQCPGANVELPDTCDFY